LVGGTKNAIGTLSSATGAFTGIFAGLGHTVSNLTENVTTTNYGAGLFGLTYNATIRDLGLRDATITGTSWARALAGQAYGGNIHHVYSENGTISSGSNTGGLIGGRRARTDAAALLVVDHAYVLGGSVIASGNTVGGLVGTMIGGSTLTNSHVAEVTVTGPSYVGGLAGTYAGTVLDSWADVEVIGVTSRSADSMRIGGLIGDLTTGTVKNSFALGNVTGTGRVGGLVGNSSGSNKPVLENVYASGDIFSIPSASSMPSTAAQNASYLGGLLGYGMVNISYAHATGNVALPVLNEHGQVPADFRAPKAVGGLAGVFGGSATGVYATGNVNSPDVDLNISLGAGGLMGVLGYDTTISNSYSLGDVAGGTQMGGLIGEAIDGSIINNSYAGGAVYSPYGTVGVGGLIGISGNYSVNVTVENSYWNADANPGLDGFGAAPTDKPDNTLSGLTGIPRNDAEIISAIMAGRDPVATVINPRAAARAAEAARVARVTAEVAQVAGAVEPTVRDVAENAPDMSTVSDAGSEMQVVDGLPGDTLPGAAPSTRTSADSGWGENGETLTLSALGLRSYSATVRALTTDDGDVYELEDEQE
jgi:hypothetical protein